MRSPVLTGYLFSSAATLGVTHAAALHFFLYWQYPWLDIPVHILGGIVVAFAFLLVPSFYPEIAQRYMALPWILVGVLIIGLSWELFEIMLGIPLIEKNFEADMVLDLCMDLFGGGIGYFLGREVRTI